MSYDSRSFQKQQIEYYGLSTRRAANRKVARRRAWSDAKPGGDAWHDDLLGKFLRGLAVFLSAVYLLQWLVLDPIRLVLQFFGFDMGL